jgi:L-fuculose-phosphate aldolase
MHALQRRFEAEIREMVEVCHALAQRQYATSHGGNVSWRVEPEAVLITPTTLPKGKTGFNDIVVVGMDRKTRFAAAGRRATGEAPIHLGILEKRPDIASIIHAHPPWMTALALSRPELLAKAYLPEPTFEVGPIAQVKYAQPLTEELARNFEPVIQTHNAFLMRNHGALMLSIAGAQRCFDLLEMIEVTAKSVAIAEMLGGAKPLNRRQVRGLDETLRARKLRLPGAPGQVRNLADLYS